jgi:CheY-like chemotaxis protein
MFSSKGADVRGAVSAAEAMGIFEQFRPQLVVSDIGMPGEDGLSLMRSIRALCAADGGEVRALALTALASVKDREDALAAGFNMHLAKPIGFDELTEALHALMQRRQVIERRVKRNS